MGFPILTCAHGRQTLKAPFRDIFSICFNFSVSFLFKILNSIALLFKFLIFADEDWQSIISSYTSAILTKLHKEGHLRFKIMARLLKQKNANKTVFNIWESKSFQYPLSGVILSLSRCWGDSYWRRATGVLSEEETNFYSTAFYNVVLTSCLILSSFIIGVLLYWSTGWSRETFQINCTVTFCSIWGNR